jgi:hypothetical protein
VARKYHARINYCSTGTVLASRSYYSRSIILLRVIHNIISLRVNDWIFGWQSCVPGMWACSVRSIVVKTGDHRVMIEMLKLRSRVMVGTIFLEYRFQCGTTSREREKKI